MTSNIEVIVFYNDGGGVGRGLDVPNQTLPTEALDLTEEEQAAIIAFMHSLTENISMPEPPLELPSSSKSELNNRQIGGEY